MAIGTVIETGRALLDSAKQFVRLIGGRNFSDINKEANKHSLTLYALVTENIDSDFYRTLITGIEGKFSAILDVIFSNYVGDNINDSIDYIQRNLTGSGIGLDGGETIADTIKSMHAQIKEAGIDDISNVSILNEKSTLLSRASEFKSNITSELSLGKKITTINTNADKSDDLSGHSTAKYGDKETNYLAPSTQYTVSLQGKDTRGQIVQMKFVINFRVQLMVIPSTILLNALEDAKNRGWLDRYLEYRAGKINSKELLLNLKSLEREAHRDTSSEPSQRIVSELLSKRGLTLPMLFTDLVEFKNFIVVLDISDVDRFSRDTKSNLMAQGTLKRVFDNFNILSLMVVDLNTKKLHIFDSDNPNKSQVITTNVLSDDKRARDFMAKITG